MRCPVVDTLRSSSDMETNDNNRPGMGARSGLDHADCEHVGPLLFTIMGKAPAFQFYSSDFLTGTMLMSMAEVGLYIRLLCLQAEHGAVPDDVERIVQAFGEPSRVLWPAVRVKFAKGETQGTLVNTRLSLVLQDREAYRKKQSVKGKISAEKRFNRGSTVVEPLEGRGEVEVVQERKEREPNLEWPTWAGPNVKAKWCQFKVYRNSLDRFRYKTDASEQAAINTLAKYYTTGKDMVAGIEMTMAKGWKFPVDPKELAPKQANGKPVPMTRSEANAKLEEYRAANGIDPGGVVETHLIPADIYAALK